MITVKIDKSKNMNGEYSLYVSFPYDNRIVEIIRAFPSRYWIADDKQWELPFNKLGVLIQKLPEQEFDITGPYITLEKPKAAVPKNFKFKTKPFEHQITSFNYGLQNDRWFLGDEQGLGKTKQVIDIAVAKKLQKGYEHCLIVCGVNGLKWNWVNEVHTHSDEEAYILGQRVKRDKITIGSNADKLTDVERLDSISSYFIITNVETFRNEEITKKVAALCKSKKIGLIAIDEIHKCKNPGSEQGKGILKLESECRIAMTGTPLMNKPLDLYIILKWLGYEKHTMYAFKKHYCEMGGFGGYEIVGYKNLDELQENLSDIMVRRLKTDVFDLPEKLYVDEYVDMTAKQAIIYKEIAADIKANIDQIKMSNNPLAELIRMRQATGYTGILSSTIKESAKLDRMVELVEDALENNRKVVIFSNWTQMTDEIYKRLWEYNPARITGQTSDADRQLQVDAFQNNEDCKIIIGTIGAMGTGLTLTAGTVEIFMDEPWSKALKDQAEDRCHRIGTTENITIYTLMCKDTIDERIHELVQKKGMMSDALVDGQLDVSNSEILDFLLN